MGSDFVTTAQILTVIATFIGTVTAIGVGAYALVGRIRRKGLGAPPLDDNRLQRLELAVDAIAVEVERISEAQRFAAKLLAGRRLTTPVP